MTLDENSEIESLTNTILNYVKTIIGEGALYKKFFMMM